MLLESLVPDKSLQCTHPVEFSSAEKPNPQSERGLRIVNTLD